MKIYRNGTGEKYTPFDHFNMTTQAVFNPEGGCEKMNFTLSTLAKGAGSDDEVHPNSDQIFYMLYGGMVMRAFEKDVVTLNEGDAILVKAGETHSVINRQNEECGYIALTVPPLEKTH